MSEHDIKEPYTSKDYRMPNISSWDADRPWWFRALLRILAWTWPVILASIGFRLIYG